MTADPTLEDWRVLGLEPGAGTADVRRVYAEKRRLYGGGALASYQLFEDAERADVLRRLDEAFAAILGEEARPEDRVAAEEPMVDGPDPDRETRTADYLRHHRLRSGLSVQRLAVETKIRPEIIEAIELGEVEKLPAAPYVRGFVAQIAELLGLDAPRELAETYIRVMGPAPAPPLGTEGSR